MKINWKVRLRNKPWVAGLVGIIVTFAYDIMAAFEIVPAVDESHVMSLIKTLLTLLLKQDLLLNREINLKMLLLIQNLQNQNMKLNQNSKILK